LAEARYPDLISLAKKGFFQSEIFRLTYAILDQDSVDASGFNTYQKDYQALLEYNLNAYKNAPDSARKAQALALLPDLVQLLEKFSEGDDLVSLMEDLVEIEDAKLQEKAIYILLTNGQKVSKKQLEALQTHWPEWYGLLQKLHKKGQLALIPEKQLSQAKVAVAAFHHYLSQKRKMPEEVKFIKKEEVLYQGKRVNIYVFKFKYTIDSDNWYLGISGPQPTDVEQYDFSNEFTSISWQEYDEALLETQINRLLYRLKYR